MHYFILGDDDAKKTAKIEALKQKHLSSAQARKFDYEDLDGDKLAADVFKKTLLALPAVAAQRLVILRSCHKLKPQNQTICAEFLASRPEHVILILEAGALRRTDAFLKQVAPYVQLIECAAAKKKNVFDMTRLMERGDGSGSLQVLGELLQDGSHPLQIMGGVVWFWGQQRTRLSAAVFEQGLQLLQEADLNLKRSRMNADQAMELLVVRLCALLS